MGVCVSALVDFLTVARLNVRIYIDPRVDLHRSTTIKAFRIWASDSEESTSTGTLVSATDAEVVSGGWRASWLAVYRSISFRNLYI